jgi:Anti-sigma factor NepR
MTDNRHSPKSPASPALETEARRRSERIGMQLRQLYDGVLNEGVPDEFLRLLDEADKAAASPPAQREGSAG